MTWEVLAQDQVIFGLRETLGERTVASVDDAVAWFDIPMTGEPAMATIFVRVSYGYCGMGENALCRLASTAWRVPVKPIRAPKTQPIFHFHLSRSIWGTGENQYCQ